MSSEALLWPDAFRAWRRAALWSLSLGQRSQLLSRRDSAWRGPFALKGHCHPVESNSEWSRCWHGIQSPNGRKYSIDCYILAKHFLYFHIFPLPCIKVNLRLQYPNPFQQLNKATRFQGARLKTLCKSTLVPGAPAPKVLAEMDLSLTSSISPSRQLCNCSTPVVSKAVKLST